MTAASDSQVRCEKCGTAFSCTPEGACWCMEESFKLPMPTKATSCLCPKCLRVMAQEQKR
jgi:hypothetical protein